MFDHTFQIVPHYRIGPLHNSRGYILAVAEIGEVWILRYESPTGEGHSAYFKSHDEVIRTIHTLQNLWRANDNGS